MQSHLEQRALKISIAMTLVVAGLGVALGLLAGSQSILFDGMFSTIDAAMSGLALLVSRLAVREASQRFQHGYWHFEPMVAAFNGAVLTLLCCYAFLNAVQGLLEGGRDLAFGVATAYAVVVTCVCFVMYIFEKGVNREADSEFLRIDTQSWLMAALITSALLAAFVIASLLEGTALDHWTPYVDSLLLAVLTVCFLPVPLGIVRRAMKEVFLIAPSHIDREVHDAMQRVMQRDGLLAYHSHVAKTGRGHFIEIHIITREDFASQRGMVELDEIRAEIAAHLSIPPQHRWFTVAFTADPRWA
jgi:cation diffusion facilitator family transporter